MSVHACSTYAVSLLNRNISGDALEAQTLQGPFLALQIKL